MWEPRHSQLCGLPQPVTMIALPFMLEFQNSEKIIQNQTFFFIYIPEIKEKEASMI
jgi:hypothetical protein